MVGAVVFARRKNDRLSYWIYFHVCGTIIWIEGLEFNFVWLSSFDLLLYWIYKGQDNQNSGGKMNKWLKIILLIVFVIGLIPFQYGYIYGDKYSDAIFWSSWILLGDAENVIAWAMTIPGRCNHFLCTLGDYLPRIQIAYGFLPTAGLNIRLDIRDMSPHHWSDYKTILGWAEDQGFY